MPEFKSPFPNKYWIETDMPAVYQRSDVQYPPSSPKERERMDGIIAELDAVFVRLHRELEEKNK